jgi:hypothetical protein
MNNVQRDRNSGAIINTDKEALNKYKLQKKYNSKVDNLEKEILLMKNVIESLLNRIEKLEQ